MAWYQDYFTTEWMRFRDIEAMLEKTPSEVDFLEKALGISPPGKVLDVGCGFGRHAIELAARGYRVTGLDLSSELLKEAKKRSRQRGTVVTWVKKDMREMEFDAEFDAVISLYIFWLLRNGGRGLKGPEAYLNGTQERSETPPGP